MALDGFDTKTSQPEHNETLVRFVGGSGAVTKVEGNGVTVSYTSTGIVTLTWAENPGRFVGCTYMLQATTPADVKGHTVTAGVFNTTTFALQLHITNASETLHDLAALEWCNLRVSFARTGL